MYSKWRCR